MARRHCAPLTKQVVTRGTPAVIGLDIGTSAVKGILAAGGDRIVMRRERSHPLSVGAGGRAEVDARRVLAGAEGLIRSLAEAARTGGLDVRVICAGGSGDEAVWLDVRHEPVAPIPMSLDTRSEADGEAFAAAIGRERLVGLTGLPPAGAYPLVRMRWLARTLPAVRARVHRLLAWPEYLAQSLGVEEASEPTLAARTAAFGIREGRYLPELLAAAAVDPAVLAPVAPTGTILGLIPAKRAEALGLGPEVSVVTGGFDQAMATLGAGVRNPGIAHIGAGSWEAVTILVDGIPDNRLVLAGYSAGPSIGADGRWSVMASGPGASALAWLGGLWRGAPAQASRRAFAAAAGAPDGPTGLIVLPHLDGAAAPHPERHARAVIAGLDLFAGPERIARAMLEGVALDLAERLDRLAADGHRFEELRVSGGGARDGRWLQLKADVTGIPVRSVVPADAGTVAAAALAAQALGIRTSLAEAVDALHGPGFIFEPRPPVRAAYLEMAARRRALRSALGLQPPGRVTSEPSSLAGA